MTLRVSLQDKENIAPSSRTRRKGSRGGVSVIKISPRKIIADKNRRTLSRGLRVERPSCIVDFMSYTYMYTAARNETNAVGYCSFVGTMTLCTNALSFR